MRIQMLGALCLLTHFAMRTANPELAIADIERFNVRLVTRFASGEVREQGVQWILASKAVTLFPGLKTFNRAAFI